MNPVKDPKGSKSDYRLHSPIAPFRRIVLRVIALISLSHDVIRFLEISCV